MICPSLTNGDAYATTLLSHPGHWQLAAAASVLFAALGGLIASGPFTDYNSGLAEAQRARVGSDAFVRRLQIWVRAGG